MVPFSKCFVVCSEQYQKTNSVAALQIYNCDSNSIFNFNCNMLSSPIGSQAFYRLSGLLFQQQLSTTV